MALPLGFRVREKREIFWIQDPAVDHQALAPAIEAWLAMQRGEPRPDPAPAYLSAYADYIEHGATAGIPLREGVDAPTRVVIRPLTAEERARIDWAATTVRLPETNGQPTTAARPEVKVSGMLRSVLAFAVGADVPAVAETLTLDGVAGAQKIRKWIDCPDTGLRRLHPAVVSWLASDVFGQEGLYFFGRLVLSGSEATAEDTFRAAGGDARRGVHAAGPGGDARDDDRV